MDAKEDAKEDTKKDASSQPDSLLKLLDDAKPGDMVEFVKTGLSHWGIYVGNGCIIHFDKSDSGLLEGMKNRKFHPTTEMVKKDKIAIVMKNPDIKHVRINNYLDDKEHAMSPDVIVWLAKKTLRSGFHHGYDVFYNNCEHFVTSCRYGYSVSQQVNDPEKLKRAFRSVDIKVRIAEEEARKRKKKPKTGFIPGQCQTCGQIHSPKK